MPLQRTLSIIKPDAVEKRKVGAIIERLEAEGFKVCAMKRLHLTLAEAKGFYAVHRERPFFGELTTFMSRGPIVVMVLEREDAIVKYREVIGATDPAKAAAGTLRKLYGADVGENALHGSDSAENAAIEVSYFFAGYEVSPLV
ncbi:MAG TPA: nucleoside-diphosphate kinase [Polyangiaceae bacterium]|nr:nucleoside-diphosphate kinase [Polyangiaceae bacterium]